ncbi:hypothetical protein, partial [Caballeronia humi]|uniref:hypothetical protein n=1 Tax=Caballeronia humi TaxID=326474 RepID=UPI0011788038
MNDINPLFAFAIAIAGASTITAGCAVQTGNEGMSKEFSLEGFQAAYLPHPGNITFIESWSREPKIESADQYPDAFKFRCIDAKGNIVPKDRAKLCIPIVEFNVNAVDEAGKPHQFKGAYFISITAYGPNHRFVEVVGPAKLGFVRGRLGAFIRWPCTFRTQAVVGGA